MDRIVEEKSDAGEPATTRTWDQLGNETSVTAPGGAITRWTYDSNGEVLSETTPVGARTEFTWDWMGRKLTESVIETKPLTIPPLKTEYVYGPGGWLAEEKSPADVVTRHAYNAAGEVTADTDGAGNTTRRTYDLAGREIRVDNPDDTARAFELDVAGNQLRATDLRPDGTTIRSSTAVYDAGNRQISATDAKGATTTWTRNAVGAVISQTEPTTEGFSITSTFAQDAVGNLTRFTDGRGNSFRNTYNSWNLLEAVIEPTTAAHPNVGERTWTTIYDALKRPSRVDAPGGVTTTRTYDSRGNLTREEGAGAETSTTPRTFAYDAADRMIKASAPGDDNTFAWDDRGNLLSTAGPSGGATLTYDADGRMTSRADAAGTSSYTWDGGGRLATLTDAATGSTQTHTYDATGNLRTTTYGSGGGVRSRSYDNLHRLVGDTLSASGGATVAAITYGYDLVDHRTSRTTSGLAGAGNDAYTYDMAGRLVSWTRQGDTVVYGYDASGNRTRIGARTQTFDARNRLATADEAGGTTIYTWTARGTLASTTGAAVRTAAFDAFDQLVRDTAAAGNAAGASGPQIYQYDALARQVSAGPDVGGSGPNTTLTYSGTEHDLVGDRSAKYSLDPDGAPVANKAGSSGSLMWRDSHNDYLATFAPGGTLSASVAYDPLGRRTDASGALPGEVGFQSDWNDPSTGQIDMWHRHYDPATSSFVSRDFVSQAAQPRSALANLFSYGGGDPLNHIDPTGNVVERSGQISLPARHQRFIDALAKVMGPDERGGVKLNKSDAYDLGPAWITTEQAKKLIPLHGVAAYPIMKMANYCRAHPTETLCKWRHSLGAFNYMDGVTCSDKSAMECLVLFVETVGDGRGRAREYMMRMLDGGDLTRPIKALGKDDAARSARKIADSIVAIQAADRANGHTRSIRGAIEMVVEDFAIKIGWKSLDASVRQSIHGTRLHKVLDTAISALGRDDVTAEVPYLNEDVRNDRPKGHVRPDIVVGSDLDDPREYYEMKTGGAYVRNKAALRKHLPGAKAKNIAPFHVIQVNGSGVQIRRVAL